MWTEGKGGMKWSLGQAMVLSAFRSVEPWHSLNGCSALWSLGTGRAAVGVCMKWQFLIDSHLGGHHCASFHLVILQPC